MTNQRPGLAGLFLALTLAGVPAAQAQDHPVGAPTAPLSLSALFRYTFSSPDQYRLGDEWGKKPVTQAVLDQETEIFRRAALATASYKGTFGGATAFAIGKFNGHLMLATNYHVAQALSCRGTVNFKFLGSGISLPCERIFGQWPEIDLALFSIQPAADAETAILAVARNFNFSAEIYPGQEMLTIGYGSAGNPGQAQMVANQDSDCKVFSEKGDFRLMADPDDINPGPYKAWSFANGCDVSHGDSGSAYVDRKTGEVTGIVWTGKIPKNAKVQSSAYLDELYKTHSPEIWTELTYSVPASKMREHLLLVVSDPALDPDTRATIQAILDSPGR